MKERPIIFNAEMVRAILDGRKTQTRRVMKIQPKPSETRSGDFWFPSKKLETMVHISDVTPGDSPIADCHLFFQEHCCPFGKVGDRLWVREAWTTRQGLDDISPRDISNTQSIGYIADKEEAPWLGKIRPSIHMPRWASRITLEITGVRVERLNDISEENAIAEGCVNSLHLQGGRFANENFAWLWKSIYGDESWEVNPWVWVIEFKRMEATA